MARLIVKTAHGPKEVKIGDKTVSICMCGLTDDPNGFCSGKHKKTLDEKEGVLYMYDEDYNREEVGSMADDHDHKGHSHEEGHSCDCGGNCGCHDHD